MILDLQKFERLVKIDNDFLIYYYHDNLFLSFRLLESDIKNGEMCYVECFFINNSLLLELKKELPTLCLYPHRNLWFKYLNGNSIAFYDFDRQTGQINKEFSHYLNIDSGYYGKRTFHQFLDYLDSIIENGAYESFRILKSLKK